MGVTEPVHFRCATEYSWRGFAPRTTWRLPRGIVLIFITNHQPALIISQM